MKQTKGLLRWISVKPDTECLNLCHLNICQIEESRISLKASSFYLLTLFESFAENSTSNVGLVKTSLNRNQGHYWRNILLSRGERKHQIKWLFILLLLNFLPLITSLFQLFTWTSLLQNFQQVPFQSFSLYVIILKRIHKQTPSLALSDSDQTLQEIDPQSSAHDWNSLRPTFKKSLTMGPPGTSVHLCACAHVGII